MTTRLIPVAGGRKVAVAERGSGAPLVYLHDFADIHGATAEWLEFHERLAAQHRVIAPAHPGCAGSDEDAAIDSIDDVVFAILETLDALGIESTPVVGAGIGGWIAAELAVRHRRLVERLALIGPAGLYLPSQPIADIFMAVQPRSFQDFADLRRLLFADPRSPIALSVVPDSRMTMERELLRYQMFRFAGRIGFNPPYLHHRQLAGRLARFDRSALILAGEKDGLVPVAHARAYAARLPQARLATFPDAGHSLHIEKPAEAAGAILDFLKR